MTPWEGKLLADERGHCPMCGARFEHRAVSTASGREIQQVMAHEERCPVPDAKKPRSSTIWTP